MYGRLFSDAKKLLYLQQGSCQTIKTNVQNFYKLFYSFLSVDVLVVILTLKIRDYCLIYLCYIKIMSFLVRTLQ